MFFTHGIEKVSIFCSFWQPKAFVYYHYSLNLFLARNLKAVWNLLCRPNIKILQLCVTNIETTNQIQWNTENTPAKSSFRLSTGSPVSRDEQQAEFTLLLCELCFTLSNKPALTMCYVPWLSPTRRLIQLCACVCELTAQKWVCWVCRHIFSSSAERCSFHAHSRLRFGRSNTWAVKLYCLSQLGTDQTNTLYWHVTIFTLYNHKSPNRLMV